KDADVVIWNHHPLSTYAIVDRVYIDGQKYYDRQDDQKRLTELAREKDALVSAEKAERERQKPTSTGDTPAPREDSGTSGGGADLARSRSGSADQGRAAAGTAGQIEPRLRTATRGVIAITNARIFPIAKPPI